jgi:hypothetical protein
MPDTPYKGLTPYSEEDAQFFFGRKQEREIITANLVASRLTLLYGASGVGKTSVLRAGVTHHLRRVAQQNLVERGTPEFAVVVFSAWHGNPLDKLADRVKDSVTRVLNSQTFEPVPPSNTLAQTLQAWVERVGGELFIILDQFEEYFDYQPWEDGEGTFAVEFPRAVNCPDLHVNFLVAIREDSLAKLDCFKGRIPNLFDNYLRIEYLDREAARAAIEKPIEQYNRLHVADGQQVSIEPGLVEAVLKQVKLGQVFPGEAGRGSVGGSPTPSEARIETPYLQLVMTRLWDEEMAAGSPFLRLETLKRLGGAKHIVGRHLEAVMSALPSNEQEAAARVFHHLVTPHGTKIAQTVPDLAEYTELPKKKVHNVLATLCEPEFRILRKVTPPPSQPKASCYEIFHDVVAWVIRDWQAQHMERQRAQARRRGTLWRLIALDLLVTISIVIFGAASVSGWEAVIAFVMNFATNFVVALFVTLIAAIVFDKIYMYWRRVTAIVKPQTITFTTERTPWQILVDGCRSLIELIFLIIVILLAISFFGAASVFGWERVMTFVRSVVE